MSRYLDPNLATPGDWHLLPTTQTVREEVVLPTYVVVATGACEQFVGRVHPRDGLTDEQEGVRMDGRLFAASKAMARLLERAVAYQAAQLDRDLAVSGADLLDFFSAWRIDAKCLLEGYGS